MSMKVIFAATCLVLSGTAQAATLYASDFAADNGGVGALNYTGLSGLTVTGNVDLVEPSNPYGISTPMAVVDLDGTTGPGRVTSNSFAYHPGEKVTLTFVLGGAQRGSASDEFEAGFNYTPAATLSDYALGGTYGTVDLGNIFGTTGAITTSSSISGDAPFSTYSLSFTASNAGSFTAFVGTTSADNIGPLLSGITLADAVPEPASWALMVAGFGLVGVAARRRSNVFTA